MGRGLTPGLRPHAFKGRPSNPSWDHGALDWLRILDEVSLIWRNVACSRKPSKTVALGIGVNIGRQVSAARGVGENASLRNIDLSPAAQKQQ